MICISFGNQEIFFDGKQVSFESSYNLMIQQVLVLTDLVVVLGLPRTTDSRSPGFVPFIKNIFAFDLNAELIWNAGLLESHLVPREKVEIPASYMALEDGCIKAYYQSDHEVWINPKTGETIREEFVFKK